ncbi:MAG: HYR domain-containing protein, partial [Saprospiraceae bacterium]|nr:HYR domain-containing protein [Saprospiraceae bacterium]
MQNFTSFLTAKTHLHRPALANVWKIWALLAAGMLGGLSAQAAIINVPADYPTISAAVAAASPGDEIVVAPGTYNENVLINKNNLTLRSSGGKAVTTIIGTLSGGNGTVMIANGINGVTIGKPGQGFKIVGYDGPGTIETAAVYLLGAHQNITIEDNEIEANGEHGLLANFNAAINNIIIRGNHFTGKTFSGAEPGGCGFSTQFDPGNNVPRQLVTLGGGAGVTNSMNITFVGNVITGTAGGFNSAGPCEQGNFLVTIDVIGATISDNVFNGVTTRFAGNLRARGQATTVKCNTFYNVGLGAGCTHIFFGSANPLTGSSTPTLAAVASQNAFPNGGAYLTPDHPSTYIIYRDNTQAAIAAAAVGAGQTVNSASPGVTVTCPPNTTVCQDDAPFALTGGSPSGGTYSGPGVSGGTFDPSAAGVGTHTITYTYTDVNGCTSSCTFTITVKAQPKMVAHVNSVTVTNNNDGADDTGAFTVCGGVPNNVSITTTFSDLNGAPNARVFQTISTTNATFSPWCNSCQALLTAFVAGTNATATAVNPNLAGTVTVTWQAWQDDDNDGVMDAEECKADKTIYTITVHSAPALTCPTSPVTANTAPGLCNTTVGYAVIVSGFPAPTLSYTFTGATTGSGSGTGSGSTFNKGTTTVTITATNSCGTATCTF